MSTVSTTRVVASPKVAAYIREHGGEVWVWLDPHRCLVGSYIQLRGRLWYDGEHDWYVIDPVEEWSEYFLAFRVGRGCSLPSVHSWQRSLRP